MKSGPAVPAKGTRPPNRRQLIADTAAQLFFERGYGDVAMSDVAAAVGIGPSALYRHFRGKNDLLATVIDDSISRVGCAIKDASASDDLAEVLARAVLERRSVGVLWRRESRHLTGADRKRIRALARQAGNELATRLGKRRPQLGSAECDLLAWCAIGVANSVSFHCLSLAEPRFTQLLTRLIAIPLGASIVLSGENTKTPTLALTPQSRRENILSAATTLFTENGFSSVGVDDIGAAVGIAGPSIYNHFATKSDILSAALNRANERLWMDFNNAVSSARTGGDALAAVVRSYQSFAFDNPHVVAILLSEVPHLPDPERRRLSDAQRAFIDEWVSLVRLRHPGWTATEARIRVQACQMMVNDVVVVRRLRNTPGAKDAMADIALGLLTES